MIDRFIKNAFYSVLDIFTDLILFFDYIGGTEELYFHWDVSWTMDQTSNFFGNATLQSCSPGTITSGGYAPRIVCVRYNHWFAILTMVFIYLPSVNVIATLYGPRSAGLIAMREGPALAIPGGILAATGYFVQSPGAAISGWFMIFIGAGVFVMGWLNVGIVKVSRFSALGRDRVLHS